MKRLRSSQLLTIIFAVLFAIGFMVVMLQIRPSEVTILVPNREISPYEAINPQDDFKQIKVRENKNENMAKYELTPKYVRDLADKNKVGIFFSREALHIDQRVDRRNVTNDTEGSLALVDLSKERVISVGTTLAGSVAGIITPGDIVSIQAQGGSGAQVDNAKVIAFGVGAAPGRSITGGEQSSEESGGGLIVVLAVPIDQAIGLSGQTVNMVLNPLCMINEDKEIVSVEGADADASGCPGGAGGTEADSDEPAAGDDAATEENDTADTTDTADENGNDTSTDNSLQENLEDDLN